MIVSWLLRSLRYADRGGAPLENDRKFDLRLQAPIFFIWSTPGSGSSVAPTFTLSAGLRF